MFDFYLQILTNRNLEDEGSARRLFDFLDEHSELTPEKCGNFEPLRGKYAVGKRDDALRAWKEPFFWMRKKPDVRGMVFHRTTKRNPFATIGVAGKVKHHSETNLLQMLERLAEEFDGEFGFIEYLTEERKKDLHAPGTLTRDKKEEMLFVTGFDLEKYIPDLYWATLFGPMYVKKFGAQALKAAPVEEVRRAGTKRYILKMSDTLEDYRKEAKAMAERRLRAKEHLGLGEFFSPQ